MMIGEFDFDNLFNSEPDVIVPGATWFIFVVFLIIMTLILMNLLVSFIILFIFLVDMLRAALVTFPRGTSSKK